MATRLFTPRPSEMLKLDAKIGLGLDLVCLGLVRRSGLGLESKILEGLALFIITDFLRPTRTGTDANTCILYIFSVGCILIIVICRGRLRFSLGIYILKCEASVRLCALRSQRALTLYTQRQTALLRPIYPVSAVVDS